MARVRPPAGAGAEALPLQAVEMQLELSQFDLDNIRFNLAVLEWTPKDAPPLVPCTSPAAAAALRLVPPPLCAS